MANGITRYDTPAQLELELLNTYVPIPFEQMVAASQLKRQQYEQTAASLDQKIAEAAELKAIPNSIDEDYLSNVRRNLSDIVDRFSDQDLGSPVIRRQLNAEIRRTIDPERINRIQSSYTNYLASQKAKAQLKSRGLYNEMLEGVTDPALMGRYDTSTMGTYEYLPSAYEDPTQAMRTYFTDIQERILPTSEMSPEAKAKSAEGFTIMGITDKDIDRVIEEEWRDFADTVIGQREWKLYKLRNPDWQEKGITKEQAIKGMLRDIGERFKAEDVTGQRYPAGRKSEDDDYVRPEISETPLWSLSGQGPTSRQIRRNIPTIAELTGAKTTGGVSRFLRKVGKFGDPDFDKAQFEAEELARSIRGDDEAMQRYGKIKDQAVEYFGANEFKGLNEIEEYEKVQQYVEEFYTSGFSVPVRTLPVTKQQRETQNTFFAEDQEGNVAAVNREFYDPIDPFTQTMGFEELLGEYPMDQYQWNIIGSLGNNNPVFPGGRQVGIFKVDNKGNLVGEAKTVYMSPDKIEASENRFPWKVHQANYQLSDTYEVEDEFVMPSGERVPIKGVIERSDKKINGARHSAFIARFKFQGENGPVTINVGSKENPVRTTEDILKGLLLELRSHLGIE